MYPAPGKGLGLAQGAGCGGKCGDQEQGVAGHGRSRRLPLGDQQPEVLRGGSPENTS